MYPRLLWQAVSSIVGTYVRTLTIRDSKGNRGLAINPDCSAMAVSNDSTHSISVYRLPAGDLSHEFGEQGNGPGQFCSPQKLCYSPRTGNLLIADAGNHRVQVCVVPSLLSRRLRFSYTAQHGTAGDDTRW